MLLDLAEHKNDGFVALRDVAERQGISKKYLEQIVTLFNNTDYLRTNRGYQGGYMLAKEPSKYTVGEILRITEGGLAPIDCVDKVQNTCERRGSCKTLPVWEGLNKVMSEYLDAISLQTIIDDYSDIGADEYYI
jgi:Rrf2 family protein